MFVYGCVFSDEEILSQFGLDERAKHMLERGYDISLWNAVEFYKKAHKELSFNIMNTAGKEVIAIGRDYNSMGQDETRSQFELSVKKVLKEMFDFDFNCFMLQVGK